MAKQHDSKQAAPGPAGQEWSKLALHALADELLGDDATAVERCLAFFAAETRGLWHNRARAMIARRLKHCRLTSGQAALILDVVLGRLEAGNFSEQFKDQLRLAAMLDRQRVLVSARACLTSPREYVRRYGRWALDRFGPSESPPEGEVR
jgi:hypothetical protein